jgi:hypothetical protein
VEANRSPHFFRVLSLLLLTVGSTSALLLLTAAPVMATPCDNPTISWDGGGGTTQWGNASNWTDNRLPGSGDRVCMGSNTIVMQVGATVSSIESSGRFDLNPLSPRMSISSMAARSGAALPSQSPAICTGILAR